jgi:hypothetical protein
MKVLPSLSAYFIGFIGRLRCGQVGAQRQSRAYVPKH